MPSPKPTPKPAAEDRPSRSCDKSPAAAPTTRGPRSRDRVDAAGADQSGSREVWPEAADLELLPRLGRLFECSAHGDRGLCHANGPSRDLGCHLGYHAGENVGYWSGGGLTQSQLDAKLNTMFMNSPDHRANILSPYYHYVGTAWKTAPNGAHYIAVEFS